MEREARQGGEALLLRGLLYNLLSRSFTADLNELRCSIEGMVGLLESLHRSQAMPLLRKVQRALQDEPSATDEYVKLFDMDTAPPYETIYTCDDNPYQKTFQEADVSGFYRAFGMRPKGDLPDHLRAELEFVALLYIKEGGALLTGDDENASICHEARVKFVGEHLSRWIERFRSRVSERTAKPLYPSLLEMIAFVVSSDDQS